MGTEVVELRNIKLGLFSHILVPVPGAHHMQKLYIVSKIYGNKLTYIDQHQKPPV